MKYTSAEANKLLKQLNEQRGMLLTEQKQKASFIAAIEENVEDVRPEFSLKDNEAAIAKLEWNIRTVKHAINQFNISHFAGASTIDEALVLIPMLSAKKQRLSYLAGMLPKQRHSNPYSPSSGHHIEYDYANFDINEAKKEFETVSKELSALQLALDKINNSETMEIELQ